MRGFFQRRPWLTDALLAGLYLLIATAFEPDLTPVWLAIVLDAAGTVVVLFRRRRPVLMFAIATLLALIGAATSTVAEMLLPLLAVYAVGVYRSTRAAWACFGELVSLPEDEPLLRAAAPLVQERMQLLGEAPGLLAFLFTADDEIAWDADARPTLDAALVALRALEDWTTETTEDPLRSALIDGLGLKPRIAFGPVRSAISGRRISPPLFESMQLLGKVSTIARIERLAATL